MAEVRKMKILISVTSDLVTDQRVHRAANTLFEQGFDVTLIGRRLSNSAAIERQYKTRRFKLWFEKGPLFYASFNLRLFLFLLFNKADMLLANDLDTLLPNYLVGRLKSIPIIYDNHEYYTGVPELQQRPMVRGIWKFIERTIFPTLKYVYTVNDSIRKLYQEEYQVEIGVVRNVPFKRPGEIKKAEIGLPKDQKIILYQGAGINVDRGLEEAVESMKYLNGYILLIVGGGDKIEDIKKQAAHVDLKGKIIFTGKIPFEKLHSYTSLAQIGLSLDKDTNINYRFSLPNKIFDYIQAGVPVLASRLPEVSRIVEGYKIGAFIDSHDPKHIASRIEEIFSQPALFQQWNINLKTASEQLCWEEEKKKFLEIIDKAKTDAK